MTLMEMSRRLDEAVQGLDEQVGAAPDLSPEEMMNWLRRIVRLPHGEEKTAEAVAWCCALAKGRRANRLEIVHVQ